jgi:hypothetical protein
MPYTPGEIWTATPEKTNHLTRGWYHKTLFTFQIMDQEVPVSTGGDIIPEIITVGKNYKGSNVLPAYYFADNNNDTGRGFKITVIYQYQLDGSKTGLSIGLYDSAGPNSFLVSKNQTVGGSGGGTDPIFVTSQFYCTSFWDVGNSHPAFQVSGDLMFSDKSPGTNDVYKIPYSEALQITSGNAIPYEIRVRSNSDNDMYIQYLSIEEIG